MAISKLITTTLTLLPPPPHHHPHTSHIRRRLVDRVPVPVPTAADLRRRQLLPSSATALRSDRLRLPSSSPQLPPYSYSPPPTLTRASAPRPDPPLLPFYYKHPLVPSAAAVAVASATVTCMGAILLAIFVAFVLW
uniref:Uncharacterized protein n=1 Tax=Ananas comosus var. bracteatus TaxID=296719 RepID=A0A6V7QVU8_ANACO